MDNGNGRGHVMDWRTRAGNGVTLSSLAWGTAQLRIVWEKGARDIAYVVNSHGQGDRNAALIAAAPRLASLVRDIAKAGAEAAVKGNVTPELEGAILECIVAARRLDVTMERQPEAPNGRQGGC